MKSVIAPNLNRLTTPVILFINVSIVISSV
jgi:hypothetical protein